MELVHYAEIGQVCHMDEDSLDLIDQAFLEGLIDGDTMALAYYWLEVNPASVQ